MMTRVKARQRVVEYLDQMMKSDESLDLEILDDLTKEISYGWAFFYQSKGFVEEGIQGEALVGNAPLLIDSRDGSLRSTGTACSVEYYIQNFEDTGDPHIEAIPALVISGWRAGALKISAIRLINKETHLGLAKSKRCVDDALDDISTTIQLSEFAHAERLRSELDVLGCEVTLERQAPQ